MITNASAYEGLPAINRCREFFVYTSRGERYLDLAREGGSLISGHRVKGVGTRLKGFLAKGNWGRYPSPWQARAEKALRAWFPDYLHLSFHPTVEVLLTTIAADLQGEGIFDPAIDDPENEEGATIGIWRPFLACPSTEYLIPWIPYSGTMIPVLVLSRDRALESSYRPPQYQLAALPKLISHIRAYGGEDFSAQWERFEHPLWKRRGPYLWPVESEDYSGLYRHFLDAGIILSALPTVPSVLADQLSDGEVARFRSICEDRYGRN